MTNKEFYKDKILELALDHKLFIVTNDGQVTSCSNNECRHCAFMKVGRCDDHFMEWLEEEYVEPQVDWSKVAVDTKILVKQYPNSEWKKRYFAKYEDGRVYAFSYGSTSWSDDDTEHDYVCDWKYAKLYEEGE